ncbi:2OG-Fe(II) oxygenase [Methylovirgula sp. 4M-Z18]|uniref:2OG-Fe(II) oxygenase n=1 Tax=Methylovirgula sp. 4M-Z18 TaxID=2293567 RepID=UPI000E2EDF7B|nr:2OG-Fe(II) oxygenase [Methylovirgula sp. 4M-Z18]RFB79280.1 2OG-Fe(II) oxygenase [Methylovirgula sp. 4M-Z18]
MLRMRWLARDIGTISNLLNSEECDDYIRSSEAQHFEEAPVTTLAGMVMMKDVRNNNRVMIDDNAMAATLYARIAPLVPPRVKKKWRPIGLNERFRFYRYDPGQKFDWHLDGYYERDNGERSFFTFMIYLNDDFEGGGTSFHDARDFGAFTVTPSKGMGLIFHHPIEHRGDEVTQGRKYVLRSDVMYTRI